MTVHGSKGLEFKYIFVTNMVHLRFPSTSRKDPIEIPEEFIKEDLPTGDAHLQEERRLFYVALTRAKRGVYLTLAKDYGGTREKKPSRFIEELNIASKAIASKEAEPVEVSKKTDKPKYPLPKTFSFSQLKAYESCPQQYFYSFIAKIPTPGNPYFSFGKTMHSALQKFYQLIIERNNAGQGDLFAKDKKVKYPSQQDLLNFYETSWIDDWYPSEAEQQRYHKEGIRILKDYYTKYKDSWTVPLFLEKGFTIKVNDYSVRGVFDRVDADETGWDIIDYKTGKVKEKLAFDDKKQLLIYQIAAAEVFNTKIKNLTFFYLTKNTPVSFVGTDKEIAKTKDWISTTIDNILSHDFTATPGFICNTCDYNKICPFAKVNK
jgi:DNA helicase-2/ATP-dependent DNA helicase PcrA